MSEPVAPAVAKEQIKADTLAGVFTEGSGETMAAVLKAIGRDAVWQGFQRIADYANQKVAEYAASLSQRWEETAAHLAEQLDAAEEKRNVAMADQRRHLGALHDETIAELKSLRKTAQAELERVTGERDALRARLTVSEDRNG